MCSRLVPVFTRMACGQSFASLPRPSATPSKRRGIGRGQCFSWGKSWWPALVFCLSYPRKIVRSSLMPDARQQLRYSLRNNWRQHHPPSKRRGIGRGQCFSWRKSWRPALAFCLSYPRKIVRSPLMPDAPQQLRYSLRNNWRQHRSPSKRRGARRAG